MKLTNEDKQNIEGAIQFALYKSCIEQNRCLTGLIKQNVKRIFNKWTRTGETALKHIESVFTDDHNDMLDRFSDNITDSIHELRKQITKEVLDGKEKKEN